MGILNVVTNSPVNLQLFTQLGLCTPTPRGRGRSLEEAQRLIHRTEGFRLRLVALKNPHGDWKAEGGGAVRVKSSDSMGWSQESGLQQKLGLLQFGVFVALQYNSKMP